jgi:plastocyanin
MRKSLALNAPLPVATLLVSLVALGAGAARAEPAPPDTAAIVHISSFLKFGPDDVTIHVGDTVEWRNASIETHTVTDDPAVAKNPTDADLPPGAEAFDSGPLRPGQAYRHTFIVPGRYRYFCRPHEMHGMVATVVVVP